MAKKKKIVVAKLTRIENDSLRSIKYTLAGINFLLGKAMEAEHDEWEILKKEYKLADGKSYAVNYKTREVYYEDFK